MSLEEVQQFKCESKFDISAYNGKYLAVCRVASKDIGIWFLKNDSVTLSGHHLSVRALSFSYLHQGEFLCSCSDDNVILWDLSQYTENETTFRGRVLCSDLHHISFCHFDYCELRIAFCCEASILIFDIKSRQFLRKLDDSVSLIMCKFLYPSTLLSTSKGGMCKIWNICTESATCHKYMIGVPTALAVVQTHQKIAIGTSTGNIEIYNFDHENKLQHSSSLKVWKLIYDANKRKGENVDETVTEKLCNRESSCILTMEFLVNCTKNIANSEINFYNPLYLLIVINTGLCIVNVENENGVHYNFEELNTEGKIYNLPAIMRSVLAFTLNMKINMVLTPLLGDNWYLIKINVCDSVICDKISSEFGNATNEKKYLSFLSTGIVTPSSLLAKEIQPKKVKKEKNAGISSSELPKMFQQLTFKSKVKSSGYNIAPRRKWFQPIINKRRQDETSFVEQKSTAIPFWLKFQPSGNWEKEPKLHNMKKLSQNSSIVALHITGDNKTAAFGFSDGSVEIKQLPNLKTIASLLYHNGNIINVHFSHSNLSKLLLTCGTDKRILIWDWKNHSQKPLLVLNLVGGKHDEHNVVAKEITGVQFYYMDKFILCTHGNHLDMFSYYLDPSKVDDIQRYITHSYYQRVASLSLEAKRISALAAMNQFHSHLVLCGTSSHSLDVIDMNMGLCVQHTTQVHAKPIYQIALNQGSPYSSQSSEMFDIYATAALTDGIKIWDIRTNRCIRYWKDQPNRYFPCDTNFTACGQYLLAGGEDKALYIYDLCTARVLHKITGHSDIVSNVNSLPAMSKILVATLDGNAYIYGNEIS